MVWSMVRNPRKIKPSEQSIFTIEMENESGAPLKDVEVTFEIEPKDAGKMESDKVKTDEKGCAIGISIGNVVWACSSCNRSKSNKVPENPLTFPIFWSNSTIHFKG